MDRLYFIGAYFLSAWWMTNLGWKVYEKGVMEHRVRPRVSELLGSGSSLRKVYIFSHLFIGLLIYFIYGLFSWLVPAFSELSLYPELLLAIALGGFLGYHTGAPSRSEHVDYSDFL